MKYYLRHRNSVILGILIVLTITSGYIGVSQGQVNNPSKVSGVAMLALAFFKVRLVIQEFMEVRHAPVALRWVCDGWLIAAFVATVSSYLGVFT